MLQGGLRCSKSPSPRPDINIASIQGQSCHRSDMHMPSGKRSKADGSQLRETGGPRCVKHRGALLFFASAEDLAPRLAKDVWTSTAHFQDPPAPSQCAPESRHNFDLSAVQISGLPGNDRPLIHTVTLRMARSFGVARWRHRSPPADTMSASAARYLTLDQEPAAPGSCALLNRQCSA